MTSRLSCRAFLQALAASALLIALLPNAAAVLYSGAFIDNNAPTTTLIHEGDGPVPTNGAADWLYLQPDLSIDLDVTATTITAGPHTYDVLSQNGATGTFELVSLLINLGGTNGLTDGILEYVLNGVAGTFTFADASYGGSGFNSVSVSPSEVQIFLWGGDTTNDLGIDLGIIANPVPVPGAFLLFGSALVLLYRRRT